MLRFLSGRRQPQHGGQQPPSKQQQQQQPVFEEEFILSTSTHNRLKEHELMNAIITRSAAEFVDVNQVCVCA